MRVVVVGGGLSGLFTASEMISAGVEDVLLVEAADEPGGVIRTLRSSGFSIEPGVGSFNLPHPHLSPILGRSGVEMAPARRAERYVYSDQRLVEIARSPRLLLAPVLPLGARLRAIGELFAPQGDTNRDESLDAFCRRRFGDRGGELLAWLMAAGVYAGDPSSLSAHGAFPMLAALEREHGSVIRGALARRGRDRGAPRKLAHVPVGGMSDLADALAASLGDRFVTGFAVEAVRRHETHWVVDGPRRIAADAVILAVAPGAAAAMVDRELAGTLQEAVNAPVVVVGLGGRGEAPFPEGFGALVGAREELATLGILFESSYAPSRAPDDSWLMKVIAGGATRPEVVDWDDESLTEVVAREVAQVLNVTPGTDVAEVMRHRAGIPQYDIGHPAWLDRLGQLLKERPGLHLTGWGYRGVGVAALASDAVRVATEISG